MTTKSQINALTAQALNHLQLKLFTTTIFIMLAIVFSKPLYSQNQSVPEAPFNVTASPSAVCPSAPYTYLKATSPGNNIRWYTVQIGGTPIGITLSGGSLKVSISQPTKYYAESVTPAGMINKNRTVVTVGVNTVPVITYMPANVNTNNTPGQCGAMVTYPSASAMGTPAPSITYSHFSGSNFAAGSTGVIVLATNVCGTSNSSFNVTINDVETPSIVVPADISIVAPWGTTSIPKPFLGLATASDNCGITTIYNDAPAFFPVGNTTITWTAVDYNNNLSQGTQVVKVGVSNIASYDRLVSTGSTDHSNSNYNAKASYANVNEDGKLQVCASPNPFKSECSLNFKSISSDKIRVSICDPFGNQVVSTRLVEPGIPFIINNHLSPGIYFVHATQGEQTAVIKLVKK